MTPDSFKANVPQLSIRMGGQPPPLGPQFGITVVGSGEAGQQARAPAAPPGFPQGGQQMGITMAGATKIPSAKQGPGAQVREFSPSPQHQVAIVGMGRPQGFAPPASQAPQPFPPAPVYQEQAPAGASLEGGAGEESVVVEAHGRAPDGIVWVAKYEAVFPRGTKMLGLKFA